MTDHKNHSGDGLQKRSPTIGGLMLIVFLVGVCLCFVRLGFAALPPILALLLVLRWITSPVLLKQSHWSAADSRYEPFDPRSAETPEPVSGSVAAISPQMESLGFRNLGYFRVLNSVANGGVYATLFENRKSRQYAKLWTVIVGGGPVRRAETTLAYFTEFSDGPTLVTGNNRSRPLTPRVRANKFSMSFPSVRDPRRLYEIHTAILDRFESGTDRLETAIEDPADFLRRSHTREQAKYSQSGYYYLDEERRVYRLTWRGAIFSSWKLLWPVKQIRAMLARARRVRGCCANSAWS